eukprot:CAMPEP_0117547322 /NCGR_PEP_ID=MMETSP0784-20121206/47065_1 /TAXON_ID=39447 /ORGANISM="" /LENGTH=209 /DNA_ID=CAMNT_0005344225 /DNA_START=138 /DNA_END=763 /DNA_ORIENTATION=-
MSRKPLDMQRMNLDLELALRQDGFAGDLLADEKQVSEKAAPWGDEDAAELDDLIRKLGPRDQNLASEAFMKPFFRHLRLQDFHICELGADVTKFTRLKILDLSRNPLKAVDTLPPALERLKAYNTDVCRITCKPALQFLGLGHSSMDDAGVQDFGLGSGSDGVPQRFPGLLALDLSFTRIIDLSGAVAALAGMSKLRQFCLAGSPASLL